jgi:hypothetical protein
MNLNPNHPAVVTGRTIHTKTVKDPATFKGNILKGASGNRKLGNGSDYIVKGKWSGFPMFSLTLQERATCPTSCHHWRDCYGNGMAFAQRFQHGKALETKLEAELLALSKKHRKGFVIRLHVLGDFYSVDYALFWRKMLDTIPNLYVFGYTARDAEQADIIGVVLQAIRDDYSDRWWVRVSTNIAYAREMSANAQPIAGGIPCPQQTGKTAACITCGICWSTQKPVTFTAH